MKKFTNLALSAILSIGFAASANAAVIGFDDINTGSDNYVNLGPVYEGLNWSHWEVAKANAFTNPNITNGDVSSPNFAYNDNEGTTTAVISAISGAFDFNSAYFTTWYPTSAFGLNIVGHKTDGSIINQTLKLAYNSPQLFTLDGFTNLSSIEFTPARTGDAWFVMDNADITPTPAPEPSSMVLGIMGIASLVGARRKKQA